MAFGIRAGPTKKSVPVAVLEVTNAKEGVELAGFGAVFPRLAHGQAEYYSDASTVEFRVSHLKRSADNKETNSYIMKNINLS